MQSTWYLMPPPPAQFTVFFPLITPFPQTNHGGWGKYEVCSTVNFFFLGVVGPRKRSL